MNSQALTSLSANHILIPSTCMSTGPYYKHLI
uniref:Uncharacterized protein n=1 Tax=Anguilla anguilla TaxID=7936 RepID=A0A0E9T7R4_ANGAN